MNYSLPLSLILLITFGFSSANSSQFIPLKSIDDVQLLVSKSRDIKIPSVKGIGMYINSDVYSNPTTCRKYKEQIARNISRQYLIDTNNESQRNEISKEISHSLYSLQKLYLKLLNSDSEITKGDVIKWKENYYRNQSYIYFTRMSKLEIKSLYPDALGLTLSTSNLSELGNKYTRILARFNNCLNTVSNYQAYKHFFDKQG